MGNLMTSMWTAVAGMASSQSHLNTTAHNITNVNTEGYTRQQSMITDSFYNNVAGNNKNFVIGTGTAISSIRQIRNEFYDASYRQEISREGFYEAQYDCIQEVEDLFGEVNGVEYKDTLEDLWEAMQELAKEPDSIVARSTLVNAATDFVDRSRDIYKQLTAYQEDLNTKIINTVDRINELGEQIHKYNLKIKDIEAVGLENANDLRDSRNKCLDELANLIDISYREDPDGTVAVLAEGTNFISSMGVKKIGLEKISYDSDLLNPTWPAYKMNVYDKEDFANVTEGTDTGYLKGLLMARGTGVASVLDLPKEPVRSDYKIQAEYDNAMNRYLTAVKEYNDTIDTSSMMTVMAQFDNLVSGIAKAVDNVLAPNKQMEILVKDNSGAYVRQTITVLDEDKATVGMDPNMTMGETLFCRKGVDRYTTEEVTVYDTDENGNYIRDNAGNIQTKKIKVRRYTEENPNNLSTIYTINEIGINSAVAKDYSKLPLSTVENNGEFDYSSVVVDLINIWDENFSKIAPGTMTDYNFQEYYQAMIDDMGNVGFTMKMMMESQQTMVDNIADKRDNYMGVSSDEELSALMKAQNAYNASSRFFNVINEMLETLVLGMG